MGKIPILIDAEMITSFSKEQIALRDDLSTSADFPRDIWEKMAQAGFFKIGIDEVYGGSGGGYRSIAEAAEIMVRESHNLGLPISWLYQQIVARFLIAGFGSHDQIKQYLPEMVKGSLTASFAVSEPQRGVHPKLLATTAKKDNAHWILDGEKSYLTNGPIAQLFIVIAVTEEGEKKKFTAFLVPRQTAGLKVGQPLKLNFLKPSPHGSISLNNCRLPDTAILGKEGRAYREMVIVFGEIEDIVMMGAVEGAMAAQLALLISAVGEDKTILTELLKNKLGALAAALKKIRTIAYTAAKGLDGGDAFSVPRTVNFMNLTAEFQLNMDAIINDWNLHTDDAYNFLRADLMAVMELKKKITLMRQAKLKQPQTR